MRQHTPSKGVAHKLRSSRFQTALNVACQVVYETALLLAALLFVLAPLHKAATLNTNVSRIIDDRHVAAIVPRQAGVAIGDEFPVYRFNRFWKTEIGQVRVESLNGEEAVFAYDPVRFAWPMGRQGTIVGVPAPGKVAVNLGSNHALRPGDALIVFKEREAVARIALVEVGPDRSIAAVTSSVVPVAVGHTASEFVIPTQIVMFKNATMSLLEPISVIALLAIYALGWLLARRSPLHLAGHALRTRLAGLGRPSGQFLINAILVIPAVWIAVRFVSTTISYFVDIARSYLSPTAPGSQTTVLAALEPALPLVYVLAGAAYLAYLIRTGRSPILTLWKGIRFRGGPLKWCPSGSTRHAVTWLLHLVIAYAFANTLFSFLQGDLDRALATAWPGSGVKLTGSLSLAHPGEIVDFVVSTLQAFGYMATHAPQTQNLEMTYLTARYVLWSLTIVGCLIGYGHSILGYAWGKRIRNLDFTAPGWITNAVCYGPLLGVVIWQMVPPLMGSDPIFGSGPLLHLDLAVEFYLDLAYVLTIWNLWTMFGVMTDKGVRTTGFYSVVRHPSYTMEALMFVALELKGMTSAAQWLAVSMFLFTYWVRSEREDEFMSASNPDYTLYREATPFKFIPGLY